MVWKPTHRRSPDPGLAPPGPREKMRRNLFSRPKRCAQSTACEPGRACKQAQRYHSEYPLVRSSATNTAMRVRSAVRRMCRDCYVVKKKGVVYIRCKTVKKHKQRQGFHTDAGVSAWPQEEEGRGDQCRRGFGAFARGENAPTRDSAAAAAGSSSWRPAYPLAADAPGVLTSLPWLPAWASVPAPSTRKDPQQVEVSADLHSGLGTQSARLAADGLAPLRTLGAWMGSSILSFMRRSGP